MSLNRTVLCAIGMVLAVLAGTLAVQSFRVAGLKTELAVLGRDLDQANTRVALLEESEAALVKARDGLAGQVLACQRAGAKAQASAQVRRAIVGNAKSVPAEKGKVVDDATSSRAVDRLNGVRR